MKKLPIILLPFIMLTSCHQKQDYFIDEARGQKVTNAEYKDKVSNLPNSGYLHYPTKIIVDAKSHVKMFSLDDHTLLMDVTFYGTIEYNCNWVRDTYAQVEGEMIVTSTEGELPNDYAYGYYKVRPTYDTLSKEEKDKYLEKYKLSFLERPRNFDFRFYFADSCYSQIGAAYYRTPKNYYIKPFQLSYNEVGDYMMTYMLWTYHNNGIIRNTYFSYTSYEYIIPLTDLTNGIEVNYECETSWMFKEFIVDTIPQ